MDEVGKQPSPSLVAELLPSCTDRGRTIGFRPCGSTNVVAGEEVRGLAKACALSPARTQDLPTVKGRVCRSSQKLLL